MAGIAVARETGASCVNPWTSSAQFSLPPLLIDQVIGQDRACRLVRLAASQRRFLLIVGEPGTGKSLLGRAVAELLGPPPDTAVAVRANPKSPMRPELSIGPRTAIEAEFQRDQQQLRDTSLVFHYIWLLSGFGSLLCATWMALRDRSFAYFLAAAASLAFLWQYRRAYRPRLAQPLLKTLLNPDPMQAPFIDATGLSEGALFGDVRHDPYQSGGYETAPHLLVEAGAVHRAHGGVLYIDEIGSLSADAQRMLLTAIQDRELSITGRQGGSSGTLIATGPVPCDFVLVAACNPEDLPSLSPALRSRFLGFGYEVLTASSIRDGASSREGIARFVAQEVARDGRIPHFSRGAIDVIIEEAKRRAGDEAYLTLRLRELGGLVRAAGDLAKGKDLVQAQDVQAALDLALPIEVQLARAPHSKPRLKPNLKVSIRRERKSGFRVEQKQKRLRDIRV